MKLQVQHPLNNRLHLNVEKQFVLFESFIQFQYPKKYTYNKAHYHHHFRFRYEETWLMFKIMLHYKKKARLSSPIKNDVKSATISRSFEITCLICLPVVYLILFIFKRIPLIFLWQFKINYNYTEHFFGEFNF